MKSRAKWLLATLGIAGMTGGAGAAYAQTAGDPAAQEHHWQHQDGERDGGDRGHDGWHHRHGMNGMMVHLLHQLNLTDAQKQSVHQILADARTQEQAQRKNAPPTSLAALANPGDPKHAAALQEFQRRVAERIKAQDQVHQQIYAVLTPDQKTQLAATLATRQARMAQRNQSTG